MVTVRSFAKINLGLCIGAPRPDGFHDLRTVYQTIALHDVIRVQVGAGTGIEIRCDDPRVPKDQTNTCYRIVERALPTLQARGRVTITIDKRLPVRGRPGRRFRKCCGYAAGPRTRAEEEVAGTRSGCALRRK